jgi:hypothetical protein
MKGTRNMNTAFTRILSDDRAENSIMQTITIAVSAILIASGLVTAPGLINNARDNNAKTNLANIAYAQEYEVSDNGRYAPTVANLNNGEGVRVTVDNKSRVGILLSEPNQKSCYAAFAESASGRMFFRSCESGDVYEIPKGWSATAPAGFPASVKWPATKNTVLGNTSPDFSTWSLNNGATYDAATDVLTLTNNNSSVVSGLIPVDNAKSFKIAFDAKIPTLSATDNNKNYVVVGTSYYKADGITPAYNAGGPGQGPWLSNGNGVLMTSANTWQRVQSTLGTTVTAPSSEVKYIRVNFTVNSTTSQPGVSIRNNSFVAEY